MIEFIQIDGNSLPIIIEHKKMKQVRLKVFPDGKIKLSVPTETLDEWIAAYLSTKTTWIKDKLELFKKTQAVEKEEHYASGVSTRILGRQMIVRVNLSSRKKIVCEDESLVIYTSEIEQERIDRQVNNWWQKTAKQYYESVARQLYPIIEKHGIERPTIRVRKMSTLWGSCSRKKNMINLNYYLLKANSPCIEYVILHEMTHFLYPKHNKDFYDFLTIHMPDWQARKRVLDYEYVLGI
jgi:predicted metal-dependent hydrolase